ncbi:MAG: MaoC family dehydratase [Desulforhopalus sp.]
MRKKAVVGLEVGDTFSVSRTFTEQDLRQFADISRDYNPVHFEKQFATIKNFEGVICHGLLVASLVTEIGGQIGWLASGMTFQFKKPVYIGDTIKCDLTITEIDEKGRAKAKAIFKNENDVLVLKCDLSGIVPGDGERQVMKNMGSAGDPTNKLTL